MTAQNFVALLSEPERLDDSHMMQLEQWIQKYPYFQSAKALHLKGLFRQNSFRYNQALKETAIHTVDRSVLFEYITSDRFKAHKPLEMDFGNLAPIDTSASKPVFEDPFIRIEKSEIIPSDSISVTHNSLSGNGTPEDTFVNSELNLEETSMEANTEVSVSSRRDLISVEENTPSEIEVIETQTANSAIDPEIKPIEERLEIGRPLAFEKSEIHSFEEWLQITRLKPIERESLTTTDQIASNTSTKLMSDDTVTPLSQEVEVNENSKIENAEVNAEKLKKLDIIDKFIASNPKIIAKKDFVADIQIQSQPNDPAQLMTETLAKIYLEQKKYQRAIQAYEILILKYPEKSYLFADRISDIKKLQQNNTQ